MQQKYQTELDKKIISTKHENMSHPEPFLNAYMMYCLQETNNKTWEGTGSRIPRPKS